MKMTKEQFDGLDAWGFCEVGAQVRDKVTGALLSVGPQNDGGFRALMDEQTAKKAHAFESLDEIDHERFAFVSAANPH